MNEESARRMMEQEFPEYPAAQEIIRPNYAPEIRIDPESLVLLLDSMRAFSAGMERCAEALARFGDQFG
jgi:hypothetical protein